MQGALVLLAGPAGHPWAAHSTGGSVLRMDLGSKVVEKSCALENDLAGGQIVGSASAGDLDGDGCEELLLAVNAAGRHAWLLLDGKSWTPRKLPAERGDPGGTLSWLVRAGDLDGDGTPDFLGERSYSSDDLLCAFSGKTLACLKKLAVPANLKPFYGGQCAWQKPAGMQALGLAACFAPFGSADKRGVYVFDWEKGTLVHALGQR
jgi:hypothetical protein